jgi:hypothetical protein
MGLMKERKNEEKKKERGGRKIQIGGRREG